MKGLELSRLFFERYGFSMLQEQFKDILPLLAVGFTGSGSERYGFDDEISLDHDYDLGFSIFLPDEKLVDRKTEFALERAYSKLPKEFNGIKCQVLSPVGGNRNGPVRTSQFFLNKIGEKDGNLSLQEWLTIPDYAFSEAVNGEIFYDGLGEVSEIRKKLSLIPEDIRKKRIAGNLLIMAQSGQYNFMRSLKRGEKESASFCCNEFVTATIKTLFLLQGKFAPYYKWSFHALKLIEQKEVIEKLSFLLLAGNNEDAVLNNKYLKIEEISRLIIERLKVQNLSQNNCEDLEKHAYSVNDGIVDGNIRNLNILISV